LLHKIKSFQSRACRSMSTSLLPRRFAGNTIVYLKLLSHCWRLDREGCGNTSFFPGSLTGHFLGCAHLSPGDSRYKAFRVRCGCRWLVIESERGGNEVAGIRYLRKALAGPEFELVRSFPFEAPQPAPARVDVYRFKPAIEMPKEQELRFPILGDETVSIGESRSSTEPRPRATKAGRNPLELRRLPLVCLGRSGRGLYLGVISRVSVGRHVPSQPYCDSAPPDGREASQSLYWCELCPKRRLHICRHQPQLRRNQLNPPARNPHRPITAGLRGTGLRRVAPSVEQRCIE